MSGSGPHPGLVAEFDHRDAMIGALRRLREAGFGKLEVYSPVAVEGVDEILGRRRFGTPLVVFIAGVAGAAGGFLGQYYGSVIDYPLNVGGRPLNSWPAFATTAVEVAILAMVLAGIVGLLRACRLPRLYDRIFDAPGMERATQDRFLILVDGGDDGFDPGRVYDLLERFRPLRIAEVPA